MTAARQLDKTSIFDTIEVLNKSDFSILLVVVVEIFHLERKYFTCLPADSVVGGTKRDL